MNDGQIIAADELAAPSIFNFLSRQLRLNSIGLLSAGFTMQQAIIHDGKQYVPERLLHLATQSSEKRWAQIQELRLALEEIKAFAVAHHSDQPCHVFLHGLTVDVPSMVDAALSK